MEEEKNNGMALIKFIFNFLEEEIDGMTQKSSTSVSGSSENTITAFNSNLNVFLGTSCKVNETYWYISISFKNNNNRAEISLELSQKAIFKKDNLENYKSNKKLLKIINNIKKFKELF